MLHLSYKIIVYFISFLCFIYNIHQIRRAPKNAKFNYSYFAIIGGSMTKLFNGTINEQI